ncbi:hypothetical protein LguiB_027429 [Lonicera macranthoides]
MCFIIADCSVYFYINMFYNGYLSLSLYMVTVPSLASVYHEYALKSQFETSIYLQNLFLYGYADMVLYSTF